MLKYENIILTFYILQIFVSRYLIEGAAINERNQACSLREWGCDNGGCISFEKRCDGEINCSDGSDEAAELCSADSFGLEKGGSFSDVLMRTKRQSSRCRTAQFQCLNGQCIEVDGMCDGEVDCADGSDENLATCGRNTCADYLFRCSYGACVDGDAKCNGISQCADNSDELHKDCDQTQHTNSTCPSGEWPCVDGSCIDSSLLCDGGEDCRDGSDETLKQCSSTPCASYLFRCSYGACVDSGSDCNGKVDCADGSDESPELCNKSPGPIVTPRPTEKPVTSSPERVCVMPSYPPHGKYEDSNGALPGSVVPFATLSYSCDKGYSLSSDSSHYCVLGTWMGQAPNCERQCKPLKSTSVAFQCYKQHSTIELSCDLPQDDNSIAKAKCKDSYHLNPPPKNLRCVHGSWDYMPSCQPVCGIVAPEGEKLVINGVDAKTGEFPWHVGLFDKSSNPPIQICGGSIFHPNLVVTAAHCIYKDGVGLYPASTFAVAAGKLYRRWNAPRDGEKYVQKLNVIEMKIPDRYKGAINSYTSDIAILILESSFVFNSFVRPICINAEFQGSLQGLSGRVAGWGLTKEDGHASELLQTVTLPFVSYEDCYNNSPQSFRPLITADKICAGYTNGTALCKGDSGGGLVFNLKSGFKDLHYLFGIVSTSPRNKALSSCSAFAYTAFTDINDRNIQAWFNDIWSTYSTLS